jgi:selenocysteine lyase/cysteine desulfurase
MVRGESMIYLDNAATSFPKPEPVFQGMDAFVRTSAANPGRSGHRRAVEAESMINETRRLVARLFGFLHPERIAFTLNATDALNMAMKGLLGPTGTGGLLAGERVNLSPWREGGTGGDSSSPLQPVEMPHRLEGGTPNVFGIAGLREGVRLLLENGVENVLHHERALISEFYRSLNHPELFLWYGADRIISEKNGEGRVGIVGVNLPGFTPAELAAILDERFDIAVRAGLHCAPYAHKHLGTFPEGFVRFSVGYLTVMDDVRQAADALNEIAASMRLH